MTVNRRANTRNHVPPKNEHKLKSGCGRFELIVSAYCGNINHSLKWKAFHNSTWQPPFICARCHVHTPPTISLCVIVFANWKSYSGRAPEPTQLVIRLNQFDIGYHVLLLSMSVPWLGLIPFAHLPLFLILHFAHIFYLTFGHVCLRQWIFLGLPAAAFCLLCTAFNDGKFLRRVFASIWRPTLSLLIRIIFVDWSERIQA